MDRSDAASTAAAAPERRARYERDRAAIAIDEVAELRHDLDAAQRMTAHVLDSLEVAQKEAAEARGALAELQQKYDALLETRLVRYTAPMRRAYGVVRRHARPTTDTA
jgi:hypothetical protein